MSDYVLSIDQGTTSTRAIVFDRSGAIVSSAHKEHAQILVRPGWVEHDPVEIWRNTCEVIRGALASGQKTRDDINAIGITNQRETTVVWNKATGIPLCNAIVWQDTRTTHIVDRVANGDTNRYQERVGLPLAGYFSGTKIVWILENVPGARRAADNGELLFGTTDTWLLWNLTGGIQGGLHATDVTNASRTLFMNLETLEWDDSILADFDVPRSLLPTIMSSAEIYETVVEPAEVRGVPIAAILGDQQAASFGQGAFAAGNAKNTYGTGNFLLVNTGEKIIRSHNGLVTTVAYRLGTARPHYALEGSIAVTGSLVQWLRDNLGLIDSAAEIEPLAATVPDNGGVYVVPAFSGLFAPYWRPDARGAIVGLTRFANKGHLARAVLEATAFQTREVLDAVNADFGLDLAELRVDGGMISNSTLMQFQADILGIPVVRSAIAETTALGVAYAAGLATGFFSSLEQLSALRVDGGRWNPQMSATERDRQLRLWKKAVTKSLDWVDADVG